MTKIYICCKDTSLNQLSKETEAFSLKNPPYSKNSPEKSTNSNAKVAKTAMKLQLLSPPSPTDNNAGSATPCGVALAALSGRPSGLVPLENISGINLLLHIIQHGIVAVGNECLVAALHPKPYASFTSTGAPKLSSLVTTMCPAIFSSNSSE